MKKITNVLVGLAILTIPAAAFAQEAQSSAQPAPAGATVEEIVVTAQKRSENIQQVPIAITAVSEKALEDAHITSTEDLGALLPGLNVANSAGSGLIYLRGIGQNSGAPGVVNPISTYLDGIYIGIARLGLFDLNAVSQITLLRGPQGSLFGRNASGGIIQVATKDPTFDTNGSALVGYGNYDTASGAFYASGGLSDHLAANVSFKVRRQFDGTIRNQYTGSDLLKQESYSAQSKFLWTPSGDTSVLLNGAEIYSIDLPGIVNMPRPGGYIANDGVTTYIAEDQIRQRYNPHSKVDTKLLSLKVTHDLGWGEISNLAHGLWSDTNFIHLQGSETTGLPNPNNAPDQTSTSFTKIAAYGDDLQIASPTGREFEWIAGISFEHELTRSTFAVNLDDALSSNTVGNITSDAWAEFGQATYAVVPSTRVTGGVRYTSDALKFDAVNTVNGASAASSGVPPSTTFNQVTWRGAIDHDITDKIMIYASANRGFKAGQYNITSVINPPVKPEVVDGYEAGFKSQLFDNRLRLNAALFLQNSNNLQLRVTNAGNVLLFNAAKAKTYGADLDADAVLSEHWSLKGGFEWLPYAKYLSFPNASSQVPLPAPTIPSNCTGNPSNHIGGTLAVICDLTGYRMIFAAKIAGNLGIQYAFEAFNGKVEANVSDAFTSRYFIDPNALTSVDPYHQINASLSWRSSDDKWNARLWGTNLTYAKTGFRGFPYIPGDPPRYGIEGGMNF